MRDLMLNDLPQQGEGFGPDLLSGVFINIGLINVITDIGSFDIVIEDIRLADDAAVTQFNIGQRFCDGNSKPFKPMPEQPALFCPAAFKGVPQRVLESLMVIAFDNHIPTAELDPADKAGVAVFEDVACIHRIVQPGHEPGQILSIKDRTVKHTAPCPRLLTHKMGAGSKCLFQSAFDLALFCLPCELFDPIEGRIIQFPAAFLKIHVKQLFFLMTGRE